MATFSGVVVGTSRYNESPHEPTDALFAFSVMAGPARRPEHSSYVRCRLQGRKAMALHHYLVPGKRVLIAGNLRFIDDVRRPYARCYIQTIELLGGGSHPSPDEVDDDEQEEDGTRGL